MLCGIMGLLFSTAQNVMAFYLELRGASNVYRNVYSKALQGE
jgi:hypothetical protein